MPIVMDGVLVSKHLSEMAEKEVALLKEKGITPCLATVRAGEKPDSISYEKGIIKRLEKVGIECRSFVYPGDIEKTKFVQELEKINADTAVHGILILQPLPAHLRGDDIAMAVNPIKDVDGINPTSLGQIGFGQALSNTPCTAEAVMKILEYYKIDLTGKNAVVLGRSTVVGKPLAFLLLNQHATVTVCHSKSADLKAICRGADVLVAAVGRAKMVTKDYVRKDAIVVDVGINVDNDGKLCGDVDYDDVFEQTAYITPVPKGVGSVTTAVLSEHVICSAKYLNNL